MLDDGIPLTREEEIRYLREHTPYDAVIIINCHGSYLSDDILTTPDEVRPAFVSMAQYGVPVEFIPEANEPDGYGSMFNLVRTCMRKVMHQNKGTFLKTLIKELRKVTKKYKEKVRRFVDEDSLHDTGWHLSDNGTYLDKVYQRFSADEGACIPISVYLLTNPAHPDVVDMVVPQTTRTALLQWCARNSIRNPLFLDASCGDEKYGQERGTISRTSVREKRLVRNRMKRQGVAMGGTRRIR
jgi:hypothetical protein